MAWVDPLASLPDEEVQLLRQRAAELAQWRPHSADGAVRDDVAVLSLGDESWGISLRWVRGVIAPVDVTPIPGAPAFVRGVFVHRGNVLAMVDLQLFLQIPGERRSPRCVLVLAGQGMEFAIETPRLHGYRSVAAGELSPHVGQAVGGRNAVGVPLLGVTSDRLAVLDGAALLAMPELVVDQNV
jgi:purine-binding chemotaxis protein CheW